MAEKCAGPGCLNDAETAKLCRVCERKWMHERDAVVDEAGRLTDLAARFVAWCVAHDRPDPYRD